MDNSKELWSRVDEYLTGSIVKPDAVLDAAIEASNAAGLPSIAVSASQGKLLQLLAQFVNARRILEIGTLGGYSTIWLARGLASGGRLITLEFDPKHAEVARANLARAGLDAIVEVRVGKALDTLPAVEGPFNLTFVDANKNDYPEYFDWALRLTRPGGVMVFDNVVRDGKLIDSATDDVAVKAMRRLHEKIAAEPRVSATTIQTVGVKGYDGLTIARVVTPSTES